MATEHDTTLPMEPGDTVEPESTTSAKTKASAKKWATIQIRRPHVLVCPTGHGFGHAARMLQVVTRLMEAEPTLEVTIVSAIPEWFLRDTFPFDFRLIPLALDFGSIQRDALAVDSIATLQRYTEFVAQRDIVFQQLKDALGDQPVDVVFADIPPLAGEIGEWLGVPVIGMTNFSWDWIYEEYALLHPEYEWIIEELRLQYASYTYLLELPYCGDLSAFPDREAIPWVCRPAKLEPSETRKRLGLDPMKPLAVISFGGIGMSIQLPTDEWAKDIEFLVTAPMNGLLGGGKVVENAWLKECGVGFPDLIKAATLVVSKPGYGIVSECIANRTPLLYTPRTLFREYPKLVAAMNQHLRSALITPEQFSSGDWKPAFESLFAKRGGANEPDVDLEGDTVAADAILNRIYR